MTSRYSAPKKSKAVSVARYGIAEWFGTDPRVLSSAERAEHACFVPRRAVYTRLDNAIDALNATRPVGKTAFEAEIADCIRSGRKTFRL